MRDTYPQNFEIEIDRGQLRKYLRAKYLLLCLLIPAFFSIFIGMIAAGNIAKAAAPYNQPPPLPLLARCLVKSLGASLLCGAAGYFMFSHRLAARVARTLEVTVEGPFLRIRERAYFFTDRKLHFRSIIDYTTIEGVLSRQFGIQALRMMTIAGGPQAALTIHGIKDCLKVRDMLSEIDRLRENG